MAEPKVKVLDRKVISKQTIHSDKALKAAADNYVKKTTEFGKMLKEVKAASAELKEALKPMLQSKGIINASSDWRATEGDEKDTIIVEVIQRQRAETSRSRIPTETL